MKGPVDDSPDSGACCGSRHGHRKTSAHRHGRGHARPAAIEDVQISSSVWWRGRLLTHQLSEMINR